MKNYKSIFSSFHTLYRLSTTLTDIRNFCVGSSRLYKNIFKADKVVMICKVVGGYNVLKIQIKDKKQIIQKGGSSILTKREKEIFKQNKQVILDNRMICPFVFDTNLGFIYIKRNCKHDIFDDIEKKWFVAVSEQISIYLNQFVLQYEQKKILLSYIKSVTKVLNQFVPTSHLHTKSAFRLIRALGKKMKLTETEIKILEYASILHDAGKIQIPTTLLKKERPLTDDEYKLIRKHPRKGAELIKDLSSLKTVVPIIMHHHERYDGSGYPGKLKKEKIPLASRILSVIDAFDAMFFGRPYKKRMKLKDVEKEIKNQSGKQFDPKVVDSFLAILKQKSIRKYLNSCL